MAVFFAAAILSYTDRFILSLLVDPIRAELHVSDTQVSLLQGLAFALIYSFAGLPLGRFADALPRRLVIIGGVLTWSLATVACGFAHTFAELFTARVFVGVGEAALAPAAVSMIGDLFPPQRRGGAIGVFLMAMAIGSGMAILIGGALLQNANGGGFHAVPLLGALSPWRQVLVLLGAPGILVTALLLTLREPVRRGRAETASGKSLPLKEVLAGFVKLSPVLLPLYLAVAMASAGDFSLQNWTPALLQRRFGLSPGEVSATLGAISIATGAGGSLLGGFVSDAIARRSGEAARIRAAIVAGILGLAGAGIALATSSFMAIGFFTVWILMAAVSEAIGITMVQDVVPNEMRGVGASLVSFCNMIIGLGLGTTLTAVFTDHVFHDPKLVGYSITCVTAPAGVLSLLLFWRVLSVLRKRERVAVGAPS
jgi:MFS family permease